MTAFLSDAMKKWLSRVVPSRGTQICHGVPVVLSTDIGLKRTQNQDRVAMARVGPKSSDSMSAVIAIVVADGMGGMQDGGRCADIAVSSFFNALLMYRDFNLVSRAKLSIIDTNNCVNAFVDGLGGATFTAVIVDATRKAVIVHVGDSRVYSFGGGGKTKRLTVDDSLEEAFGGHGRELLQFVGMGEGMSPHLIEVPEEAHNIAITSDGIHYINSGVFEDLLSHSPDIKSASERTGALSRWCGGPDNASSAIFELSSVSEKVSDCEVDSIEVWDAFGCIYLGELKVESPKLSERVGAESPAGSSEIGEAQPRAKRTRTAKVKRQGLSDFYLDIEVKKDSTSEDKDVSRK